jgi:predicted GNAT family N-acyltransferase
MDDTDFFVTTWGADRPLLQQVRRRVFVVEQQVPEEEEWDDDDLVAVHVLATRNRDPVGTGRLTPAGKIGRLAVLSEFRGRGIGARILDMLVREASHRGMVELFLHAQLQAVHFYEKAGFTAQGREFVEAGILHIRMTRRLGMA